jgi:hypothetical protein
VAGGFKNVGSPLPDDREIIRYMKFSTLLMLLVGKVFIPKLATLQRDEPLESALPFESIMMRKNEFKKLYDSLAWFEQRVTTEEKEYIAEKGPESPYSQQVIYLIWLRELSQRRGVWCRNNFNSESMALWKLYGDRGVAIVSSIDRVKDCFLTFAFDASYGEVEYVPWDDRENFDPLESIDFSADFLQRPYYFKTTPYEFERELRFVFPMEISFPESERGTLIDIDCDRLIKHVVLSPYLELSESRYVQKALEKFLPAEKLAFRTYPSSMRSRTRISPLENLIARYEAAHQLDSPFEVLECNLPDIFKCL